MTAAAPWLDDDEPLDAALAAAQRERLLGLLGGAGRRVLDLGCGAGRLLVPLARAGHRVVGVDVRREALAACAARLPAGVEAELRCADFRDAGAWPEGPLDAILCLGNTIMTLWRADDALDLARRAAARLAPGGWLAIDDCPRAFWEEVAEGNWANGTSDDGELQMIWLPGDAVFALRTGAAVDGSDWTVRPDEPRYRLWSDGALTLLARAAGLEPPRRVEDGHLLLLHRSENDSSGGRA